MSAIAAHPTAAPAAAQPARGQPPPRPSTWRVWLRAARPYAFAASIVPVVVGAAAAALAGRFSPVAFGLTLAGSLALQTAANLFDEYYDWRSGVDHQGSLGSGHVIQDGWLAPRAVLAAAIASTAFGGLLGLLLAARAGWPILALGLVGALILWGYTAPPLKLAYRGLGEVAVFWAMGVLMVLGSYLVHQPAAGLAAPLAASLPIGLLVAAILHANNVRDLDDDRRLGKRTLAALLGPTWARREYDLLVGGAYAAVLAGALAGVLPWTSLLVLLSLPLAWRVRQIVAHERTARALVPALPLTAKLHLRFGLLLAAGLAADLLPWW